MRDGARTAARARRRARATVRGTAVAAWLLTAAAAPSGGTLPQALSPASAAGGTAVTIGLWLFFAAVLAALLLPGARALTVVRIAVPAGAAMQLWALAAAGDRSWGDIAAVAAGLAATLAVLLPAYGEAQVDAGGYGDERRFLLRPPGPALATLLVPIWAAAAAGAVAGPLLLAHGRWAAGAAVSAGGLPVAALAAHALARLARRWLVFVPNGVVVHDRLALDEPLALSRRGIALLGPAAADTAATDLTVQAFGMALELRLSEPVAARVVMGRGRREERSTTAVIVSPSRPAAVMETASRRGIKIG